MNKRGHSRDASGESSDQHRGSLGWLRSNWATAGLLVLLTFAVYFPAITSGGFIWDDNEYVTGNANLSSPEGLWRTWFETRSIPQYYPLVHTTYWIEYQLWQLQPLGYHFDNVLLHALCVVLLWRLLVRLEVPGALLAAALFAVHPVMVESVAWVTERKNVLSGACYLGAMLAYFRFAPPDKDVAAQNRQWPFYALSLVLFVGALLAKSVSATMPAAILVLLWYKRGRLTRRDVACLLPMFALGVLLGLHTAYLEKHHVRAMGPEWEFNFLQRCLIAGRAAWFYLGKLAWPHPLSFIYPRWQIDAGVWWQYLFPVSVGGLLATLWALRKKIGRGPLAAALFFGGTLLPALGFVNFYPMRYSFVADHFQYLASLGPIVLFAAAITVLAGKCAPKKRFWRVALAVVLLGTLGIYSWNRCYVYHDLRTLWSDTVEKNPNAWMAHNNLGITYAEQGDTDRARRCFERALELNPRFASALNNLGMNLLERDEFAAAKDHFERALSIDPDYYLSDVGLALIYMNQGDAKNAQRHYLRVLKYDEDNVLAHLGLGDIPILLREGDLNGAKTHYEHVLRVDPDNDRAHFGLGTLHLVRDELYEAAIHFKHTLRINPSYVDAGVNLGIVYERLADYDEAIRLYKYALQIDPDNPVARSRLQQLSARLGIRD